MMIREPTVAGSFYPDDPIELEREIGRFIGQPIKKVSPQGVISPHAGYIYSGGVAGALFSIVDIPETVVIIGPNHTGYGKTISIMTDSIWRLPNGEVNVDKELAEFIMSETNIIENDRFGHFHEHSIEVQIPFLLFLRKEITIVPISMMTMDYDLSIEVGRAIAASIKKKSGRVLIVASSDMNHYESAKITKKKDEVAIDHILSLDTKGLYNSVVKQSISMCGVMPVISMLTACKECKAKEALLVKYSNSGEVTGDYKRVVGYAGVIVGL